MKKAVLFLVLILSLSGCDKNFVPGKDDIARVYSGDFFALAETENTGIEISKNGMSISFIAKYPEEIEGLSVVLFDEHAKVEFEGMTQEIKSENLPQKAPFLLIDELLDSLSDPEDFSLSTENGKIIASGEDFSAVLSEEDFSVVTVVFPRYDEKIIFSEWIFYSDK